jgi:DNA-directed RNA polymerase subunit alpha
MFNLRCLESTEHTSTSIVSKFCIEPLKKGQSITVGNALRRTLLSSIRGIAIVGVRIFGINHEFSVVSGVKEDVLEMLLNLKQIVFKGSIQGSVIARLGFRGPGIITAKDIQLDQGLTCVEPDQYIAFVHNSEYIEMEFLIEEGEGYSLSEKNPSNILQDFLAVYAVFMPVRKVNFFVETSRNSDFLEIESLILEVETNGSITPSIAMDNSASILENMFSLIRTDDIGLHTNFINEKSIQPEPQNNVDNVLIEELELSVRAFNCLKRAHINTLGELLNYSPEELLEFKNFGKKSADEVVESLSKRFNLNLNSK